MSRILAYCFLLLAAVLGFIHIDGRPAWAPFAMNEEAWIEPTELNPDKSTDARSATKSAYTKVKPATHGATPSPVMDWLPDTGAASVHAASLIALKNGDVRAFWFAGSREGAADVVINTAVWNPKSREWGDSNVVIDRISAEKGLSRYIAKLGNPVPARLADGRLQLFFVTVSIGGWAGSSISTMFSEDEGLTWTRPQRLITSPFFNLSTLVKSPSLAFVDGRLGLPAYHEWIGRFGEFLRLDADQVLDKKRMSSGRGSIQPIVFVNDAQSASAFFRQTRGTGKPKQIPVSTTQNAGESWQPFDDLEISNPNSAIGGVLLRNGARLLALNNIETGRYRLVLMMSNPGSDAWHIVETIEDDEALSEQERREFSYPYLISVHGDDAHLVYTWDRKKIRHAYFSGAWLDRAYKQLAVDGQKQSASKSGEVK